MGDSGENGNGNGRQMRQIVAAVFLMLIGGFGSLSMKNFYSIADNSERLKGLETKLSGLEELMNSRTEERYRLSDAARDFAFDRALILDLKLRVVELERRLAK